MSNEQTLIDGQKVRMGGRDWILAPLNFYQLRVSLKSDLDNLRNPDTESRLDSFERIIHGSLERNYPGMTIEDTQRLLDMGNIELVVAAVMAASGMIRSLSSGAEVAQSDPSTGTQSTGS